MIKDKRYTNLRINSFDINIINNNINIFSNIVDNNNKLYISYFVLENNSPNEIFKNSSMNYDDEVTINCDINTWRKDYFDFLEEKLNKLKEQNTKI